MQMLKLALQSRLPLIHVNTDDIIHVQQVLSHVAELPEGLEAIPVNLPDQIVQIDQLKMPQGPEGANIYYTSSECRSMAKLYRWCVDKEKTIVFINTDRHSLQFEGGTLVPPRELVLEFLKEMEVEDPEQLLPAFGGLTLKDIGEIAKMTMTRDESLTPRGINETRRGYKTLQGITQVDTKQSFYVCPPELQSWLNVNEMFFKEPKHPSLTPRGLLFDGPPGTGKTLASKFIASVFGVPLYRLDLGAMMGKYVGDSEGNLNAALSQVDEVEPCVVILDEVEKVFQSVGDSGVTSRMLSQLLWWLQEHKSKVFTVMTTNDLTKIPPELYREGRIDKTMRFMGITNLNEAQAFAKGAFDDMLTTMGATADKKSYDALTKAVKGLFADGNAVPQTKITQTTYALLRESLSEQDAEDQPAPVEETSNVAPLKVGKAGKKA